MSKVVFMRSDFAGTGNTVGSIGTLGFGSTVNAGSLLAWADSVLTFCDGGGGGGCDGNVGLWECCGVTSTGLGVSLDLRVNVEGRIFREDVRLRFAVLVTLLLLLLLVRSVVGADGTDESGEDRVSLGSSEGAGAASRAKGRAEDGLLELRGDKHTSHTRCSGSFSNVQVAQTQRPSILVPPVLLVHNVSFSTASCLPNEMPHHTTPHHTRICYQQ